HADDFPVSQVRLHALPKCPLCRSRRATACSRSVRREMARRSPTVAARGSRYDGRFADGPSHALHPPGRAPPMRAGSAPALLFALFSAAMLGLAAGAAWMVVALYSRHPLPWLAV